MYFQKKRCIAMLLAGGQGSRLKVFPCPIASIPGLTRWEFSPSISPWN